MKVKQILAIFIVMLLVAVAVPFIASAAPGTQVWYLNDTTFSGKYVMDKGSPSAASPNEAGDYVRISAWSTAYWFADEAAQCAVGFPAGTWDGQLWFMSAPPVGTNKIKVHVGYYDTTFHSQGYQEFSPDGSQTLFVMNISAGAFTVPNTKWLMIQVENKYTTGEGHNIDLDTGGSSQSNFTSPGSDPGYPIPELPTIVLLATGLVCVAGYFGFKRRKQGYIKAQ